MVLPLIYELISSLVPLAGKSHLCDNLLCACLHCRGLELELHMIIWMNFMGIVLSKKSQTGEYILNDSFT